jgi:hypothetical protein
MTKLKLLHYSPWRRLGGEEVQFISFSILALDRGKWSASCTGRVLAPGKGPSVPIVQEVGWSSDLVWT